jgi:amino acid permease
VRAPTLTMRPPLSPRVRAVVVEQRPDGGGPPIVLVSVEGDGRGAEEQEQQDGRPPPATAADVGDGAAAARRRHPRHQPQQQQQLRRAAFSACAALSLGVLGSTVFPIPFAVSRTGLLSAALTMALVAAANDATSGWLIDASRFTGHSSYEALAYWAGGERMKRLTQLSLIALLWGTMVAGLCLIADTGRMALKHCFGEGGAGAGGGGGAGGGALAAAAAALQAAAGDGGGGRLVMLAVSALVLFPLCLQRRMRELEAAGAAGGVLVLGLVALLFWRAAQAAWRGLADVPLWSLHPRDPSLLPEAFAIYFTAFYMQPMLLPLVRDMPGVEQEEEEQQEEEQHEQQEEQEQQQEEEGGGGGDSRGGGGGGPRPTAEQGLAALRWAVRVTLYAVACGVYLGVGIAGAGAFGAETHGNILTNDVLDEGWGGAGEGGGGGGGGGGVGGSGIFGRRPPAPPSPPPGPPLPPPPPPSAAPRPKRAAAALLYALVLLYLALGMTTTQFALRSSLDIALFGAAGADVGADAPVRPPVDVVEEGEEDEEEGGEGDDVEDPEQQLQQQQQQQQQPDAEGPDQRRRPRPAGGSGGGGGSAKPPRRPARSSPDDALAAGAAAAAAAAQRQHTNPTSPPHPHQPLRPGFTWARHVLLTAGSIASAAAVACLVPRAAEKVYAVVGATGVCAVSYVIPAILRVQLYRERKGLVRRARFDDVGRVVVGEAAVGAAGNGGGGGGGGGLFLVGGQPRVVARRVVVATRRLAAAAPALSLPLLDGERENGGGDAEPYIFGAAAAALPSALLPPPPPPPPPRAPDPPPQPTRVVAVRSRPADAAGRTHPHTRTTRRKRRRWRLLPSFADVPPGPERRALVREALLEVGLPILVAAFGVLSSAAALAVAVRSAFLSGAEGGGGGSGGGGGGDAGGEQGFARLLGQAVEAYVL